MQVSCAALRYGPFLKMTFNPTSRLGRLRSVFGIIALALGTLVSVTPVPATADGLRTSAQYIVAFFRYVQWQNEERLPAWNVCFAGELPRDQERAYAGRTVREKPFVLRRINADASLGDCQALDLTTANIETATRILAKSRQMPILTVGSGPEFCSIGGQICLYMDASASKTAQKFAVNLYNIKESKLQVSARLLAMGSARAPMDDAR